MVDHDKSLEIINKSGFPFQMSLLNFVGKTNTEHGWKVLYSEHAWAIEKESKNGFIDLVLENKHRTILMVVECKRVRDTCWYFLVDRDQPESTSVAKLWLTVPNGKLQSDGKKLLRYFDWYDAEVEPNCRESSYAIVPGQDAKTQPLLERIAGELVSSVEALAHEEARFVRSSMRAYTPVIITTAALNVGLLDTEKVILSEGTIAEMDFIEVPFIRFRKQLQINPGIGLTESNDPWRALAEGKERTVFIVNVNALKGFLMDWELRSESIKPILKVSEGIDKAGCS